jgi:hypothetical protein
MLSSFESVQPHLFYVHFWNRKLGIFSLVFLALVCA